MNYTGVLFLLGRLQLVLAAALLVPTAVALALGGNEVRAFVASAAIVGLCGLITQWLFRRPADFRLGRRDAFVLVSSAWVLASLLGALPYIFIKGPGFIVDGLFESASGFTTTGATILADVESEPAVLLLWRSLTQWLGGMGIIVVGIAILPKLAVGGMQMLGADTPGSATEKLTPRIARAARALWAIYVMLTLLEATALLLAGMTPLDAVSHAFSTMATGGFSTRNASVGAYGSPLIEMIVMGFMILAGINFALHFKFLQGRPSVVFRDPEFRFYLWLIAGSALLLAVDLRFQGHEESFLGALRSGAFQGTTMLTASGFTTANYDAWPSFARCLLFLLMFVGGCVGSTSGSVKVVRILILTKKVAADLKKMVKPNAVLPVRVGRRAIPEEVVTSVTTFFIFFMTVFALGGLVMAMMGLDLVTAFSASAACLGNIGPGFGLVGPVETYVGLPAAAKMILCGLMIVGRLELYAILVTLLMSRRMF